MGKQKDGPLGYTSRRTRLIKFPPNTQTKKKKKKYYEQNIEREVWKMSSLSAPSDSGVGKTRSKNLGLKREEAEKTTVPFRRINFY